MGKRFRCPPRERDLRIDRITDTAAVIFKSNSSLEVQIFGYRLAQFPQRLPKRPGCPWYQGYR